MNIGSWEGVNGILIKISLFKSREAFDPSRRARLTKKKKKVDRCSSCFLKLVHFSKFIIKKNPHKW